MTSKSKFRFQFKVEKNSGSDYFKTYLKPTLVFILKAIYNYMVISTVSNKPIPFNTKTLKYFEFGAHLTCDLQ
ncbi:hypothetical protein QTP88_007253 [Uroleucon formosanum]